MKKIQFAVPLLWLSLSAMAEEGIHFQKGEWEVACDNTLTCRAAGYHSDEDSHPVSVLLTRKAGKVEAVSAAIVIGEGYDLQVGYPINVTLTINDRNLGPLEFEHLGEQVTLNNAQTHTMLEALTQKASIVLSDTQSDMQWRISDSGSTAVLLKMDDVQGRVGTSTAIVKKGDKPADAVKSPLPKPVIHIPELPPTTERDRQLVTENQKAIINSIIASLPEDHECPNLTRDDEYRQEPSLEVTRLNNAKLLVSTACWLGAYNYASGFWMINESPPYEPDFVIDGHDFYQGEISYSHKGRGLGDCWSHGSWAWDGDKFVKSHISSSGMCKLMAPGGVWSLDTFISDTHRNQ